MKVPQIYMQAAALEWLQLLDRCMHITRLDCIHRQIAGH